MNNWVKVGIPIVLGLVAAGINWTVLQSDIAPVDYVVLTRDVKAGEAFSPDNVEKLSLRRTEGTLTGTAVPYKDRETLFGMPCGRDLRKGDLVLWRDAVSARRELALRKGEAGLSIDLEGLKVEPGLLVVGNEIGFVIARDSAGRVEGAEVVGTSPSVPSARRYYTDGPYRVLSVGRRVSSQTDPDRGDGDNQTITVAVPMRTGEEAEEKLRRLVEARRNKAIHGIVLLPSSGK
jgi:hypothetical protein